MVWERATGRTIDRLVTIDPRRRGYADEPDLIRKLYEAASERAEAPLTYAAAEALSSAIDPLDTVVIVTGAGVPPWFPAGETDGPPGAVGLAHALAVALRARPVVVTEERMTGAVSAAATACGLADVPYDVLRRRDTALSVAEYPSDRNGAEAAAQRVLERYEPTAIVAVERLGPNADGVIGQETEMEPAVRVEPLFRRAERRGILTVGIGDRGNEIGFGGIAEEVREIYADSEHFADVACRVPTDHLVVGGSSNWGAYGVEAMISLLAEETEGMHGPERESRMLRAHAMAGSMDAITHRPTPTVDGTSEETQRGVVGILGDIVRNRLTEHDSEHLQPLDR